MLPFLKKEGHEVYTPTLTGAGERAHLLSREVSLSLHLEDVVNVLKYEELREVILVGHSYGGMVITGVADRVPERISQLVYFDGHVPDSGQAANGSFASGTTEALASMAQGDESWLLPPLPPEAVGLTRPEDIAFAARRVPHPLRTLAEPLVLAHPDRAVRRAYLRCTQRGGLLKAFGVDPLLPFVEKARASGFRFGEIDAGHDAMVSEPLRSAEVLLDVTR